ncbi:hypothetical protein VTO42DRAFT_8085 [Malbranchea cinnamomea]
MARARPAKKSNSKKLKKSPSLRRSSSVDVAALIDNQLKNEIAGAIRGATRSTKDEARGDGYTKPATIGGAQTIKAGVGESHRYNSKLKRDSQQQSPLSPLKDTLVNASSNERLSRGKDASPSPSERKWRVEKPKQSPPASVRERRSRFIEGSMTDRASEAPPAEFLGEHLEGYTSSHEACDRVAGTTGQELGLAQRIRKAAYGLFKADPLKTPSRSTSPVKQADVLEERRVMAEKQYAILKEQGYRGTAKRAQTNPDGVNLATSAPSGTLTPNTVTKTGFRELTKSKSFFNLPGLKKRSSADFDPRNKANEEKSYLRKQKLLKKRSDLQEKIARLDKEIEELGDDDLDTADDEMQMPVIPPLSSRIQTEQRRGRVLIHRPLPTIPSERLLSQLGETADKPGSDGNETNKKLPPPSPQAQDELNPKPSGRRQSATFNDNRKRKPAARTVEEEPEDLEDDEAEFLRAFHEYDNDQDSDYQEDTASNSTTPNVDYTRHQPGRKAKQVKTRTPFSSTTITTALKRAVSSVAVEPENVQNHHRRRSNRKCRTRSGTAGFVISITPGEAGYEDIPRVPTVPDKYLTRSTRKKISNSNGENKENEVEWPDEIF